MNAIQINNGQASIVSSRCINCGKCVKSCPQSAKVVIDHKKEAMNLLKNSSKVIACLAPSFVPSFYPYSYKKVIGGLKKLGFYQVWEVAVGAEILSKHIDEFMAANREKTYISTACPAFVTMIEKHYPELIPYLMPFGSPMIVTGKMIQRKYKGEDVKTVFIGPCIAKKAEALEPQFKNIIHHVLTFDELKEMFKENEINLSNVVECGFDSPPCSQGKLFPLTTGMMDNLKDINEIKESERVSICNENDCIQLLEVLSKGGLSVKLVDILMCKGCIEGPKLDSSLNHYEKIHTVYDYYESSVIDSFISDHENDYTRTFHNKRSILPLPSEDEIKKVLRMTNKHTLEDELNCGACGYGTCRNKAIAVVQGIAEVDMCLPYLLSKKTKLYEELSEKFKEISTLKDELETIIESSYDGIVVTDGDGKVLKTNRSWLKMVGYDEGCNEEFVQEMEDKGIIFPSATLLTLKEKRRISFLQKARDDRKYLATGTPIFDEEGKIKRVVTNIRDVDELNKLRKQIEETRRLEKYYAEDTKDAKPYGYNDENIVTNSVEFGEVLQLASSVAGVDSTVLILGESGVGKEVVAKFIHKLSKKNLKSFISINCGAIPENLMESELFGYETGAFTGAQKKGKPGLIELAHEGTLFLDEIGELPLNLQIKLLRVIQERRLIRLGGISETEVDVRIIAATNCDLKRMVKEGKFRSDLYYRLNVVPLEIPPLRKRKSDILPLCYHFIDIFNKRYGCSKEISASAESVLRAYSWPGNVRELENVIERMVVTTNHDVIDEKDLPTYLMENNQDYYDRIKVEGIMPIKEASQILEMMLIERACKKFKSTYEIAEALGVNQSTVVRKMQKYMRDNALKHD